MSTPQKFWMVKGAGTACAVHFERHMAEAEAERLARKHPGLQFFVMEAVAMHRKVDVERIDLRDDDQQIPF